MNNLMKIMLLLISFNCFAQEQAVNECGQTKDQWFAEIIRCLTITGSEVIESGFNMETGEAELMYNVMTIEELEEQWEKLE